LTTLQQISCETALEKGRDQGLRTPGNAAILRHVQWGGMTRTADIGFFVVPPKWTVGGTPERSRTGSSSSTRFDAILHSR
jgi:hypothetical protein